MVGGWKWKNDLFRKIFMKRHFFKKFIPFKRLIRVAFKLFATDSVEKIYYSPFIRNCRGEIVGSPRVDPILVKKVIERRRCFFW